MQWSKEGGNLKQLPVLVKSDGTSMVVSEEFLSKMRIPLVPTLGFPSGLQPPPATPAHVLPFPLESPATRAASGFMVMSLDTPTCRCGCLSVSVSVCFCVCVCVTTCVSAAVFVR